MVQYVHLDKVINFMHETFMLMALSQAEEGRGHCAPNPSVGAIAVQNGVVIAKAYHKGAGTPHAEPLVLSCFPKHTPSVTLYVTLEPCNHFGRTPPCVDAIIEHGVTTVVCTNP
jgi:diaminohydroxyphosphoribosylaminopyrimidine deaminase/5-amino-6-(5-phosphoribosylamino)uracil reductase